MRLFGWALVALCVLLPGAPARAIPVLYTLQPGGSGVATAQVATSITPLGQFVLPSVAGTVTIDSTNQAVTDFDLSFGSTSFTDLTPGYGGYDRVQINSLVLTPGPSFSSTITSTGNGTAQMTLGPVAVASVFSAQDSTETFLDRTEVPLAFTATSMTAFVTTGGPTTIVLTGIPVARIDHTTLPLPVTESADLIALGQFSLSALAVPEPSPGMLLGLGIFAVLRIGSERRVSASNPSVGASR